MGFAICFFSFIVAVEADAQGVYPVEGPMGMAAVWETTWINDTASVALMAVGWVLLFRKCTSSGSFYQHILLPISKASYGMYLCHMIVLALVSSAVRSALGTGLEGTLGIWTTPLQIVCTVLATFTITALFSTLLQRIPLVGKWIIG